MMPAAGDPVLRCGHTRVASSTETQMAWISGSSLDADSKLAVLWLKIENHTAAVAIHFMHYNFARPHKTLANPYPGTPATAAGVSDHAWTPAEIVKLSDQ
jgi:hypothetical protein